MDDEFMQKITEPWEEEEQAKEETPALAAEPLFAALLREAVARVWPQDTVMNDFVNQVAGPLSDLLGNVTAKGGDFGQEHLAQGKAGVERYLADQTLRAHLANGLFPALHVAHTLQAWGAPQFAVYDDDLQRTFMAGYLLHDFLKLPGVDQQLEAAGFSHSEPAGPGQMPLLEDLFLEWCQKLGLEAFLSPCGGQQAVLHDLIYIASNTQTRWGTLRNLSLLKRLHLERVQLDLAEQLSRLADLLAYVARTPQQVATHAAIRREVATLSNRTARFTYHHLADNRGVLTNFIHNAALAKLGHEYRVPLLYAPSGVVYLEHKDLAPTTPQVDEIAQETIQQIKASVGSALLQSRSGIKRDGKGMKYADFYWLFFDLPTFVKLGARAIFDHINEKKKPSAGKRFEKMRSGGWLPGNVDLDLPDDLRVDQMAEWCYLAEKQVKSRLPDFGVEDFLLAQMGLAALGNDFYAVPRDNRAGGVGYHWYFAAGLYLKAHGGLDPSAWRERIESFATALAEAIRSASGEHSRSGATDWDDLRAYIQRVLTLGSGVASAKPQHAFAIELQRYQSAKQRGRGTTKVCSLCSSAYRVDKQREAAVLFAPQVYSNKRPLNSTDALRDICALCAIEMMLRQILMNRSAASGGDFEGRNVRYLSFYPTYFFTPETLWLLNRVYLQIKRLSFTELRRQLVSKGGNVDLSAQTLQRLEPLLLTPEDELDLANDRYVRMHFPDITPATFLFIGIPPPGRDAKDAEAWIHPALLALLLPLCLDVKVVASESSLPLLLEADEINETVFLDAPHAAIRYLTGQTLINVDHLVPTLQRLVTAYLIHVDANARMGARGYDYRWQDLPALARALDTSPLYVFNYLKKWQRQQSGLDSLPGRKVHQYLQYYELLTQEQEDELMNHARQLTQLYRQFYRAKRRNANSILRPLSLAARTVLDADLRLFDSPEALTDLVYGALHSFIERAYKERLAYPPKGSTRPSQEQAMREFAEYFVNLVFFGIFYGDKSALRGKQINLLRNACEVIYLQEEANAWSQAEAEPAEEA